MIANIPLQRNRLRYDRHAGEKYDYSCLWLFWRRLKSWNCRQVVRNFRDFIPAISRYSPLHFFHDWNEIYRLPTLGKNFQNGAHNPFTSLIIHMKTLRNFSKFLWRISVPRRSNHKFWRSWKWCQLLHHDARNRIPVVRTRIHAIRFKTPRVIRRIFGNSKRDKKGGFVICKKN